MTSTPESKRSYINTYSKSQIMHATEALLARKRVNLLDILPDDFIAELTSKLVADERSQQRRNRQNRKAA